MNLDHIDKIAVKNDRWLFVAILLVLLSFGSFVISKMITRLDEHRQEIRELQKQFIEHLKKPSSVGSR